MKEITDNLEQSDSKENAGKLIVVDDLIEKDGKFQIPKFDSETNGFSEIIDRFLERMKKKTEDTLINSEKLNNHFKNYK